ncbi:MAG: Rpn family recombination-promoting nuclease/putative transposase [Burkholderiales bacterium]|nr:Rpn family recombination-promoting nuclease/putative transposase [Burkholderiales bacterium]
MNKHDEFVKKCLTDIGMAGEFLQTYLPSMVKDKCNFNNLFCCKIGNEGNMDL